MTHLAARALRMQRWVSIGRRRWVSIQCGFTLEVQEQIVAEIEAERRAMEENKRLIAIHEKKINAKIAEVWGE